MFIVYFKKHVTQYTMRYGVYNSWDDANKALDKAKDINTIDFFWIERKHQHVA